LDLFQHQTISGVTLESLEDILLMADVGIDTTEYLLTRIKKNLSGTNAQDTAHLKKLLADAMLDILLPCEKPLHLTVQPFVILMVGVNGAGKTTTLGKLAAYFLDHQKKVLLAAGDTFRAAAVEQLQTWGNRNGVPVIAQSEGADSASVIFDAVQSAHAKNIEVVLADTAGRLHTQHNLMNELKKIVRVIKKADSDAPHEILLVLDASIGQNALQQAKQFHEAVGVTGLVITKLDGTSKGGVIFSIARSLKLPIRFIGLGEKSEDLEVFDAALFVKALLEEN
jgi:fused signal recognition particle receptor